MWGVWEVPDEVVSTFDLKRGIRMEFRYSDPNLDISDEQTLKPNLSSLNLT